MKTAQKIALSLLISVLVFGAFSVLAFSGLFDYIEATFFDPRVRQRFEDELSSAESTVQRHHQATIESVAGVLDNPAMRRLVRTNQSRDDIVARQNILGLLASKTPAFSSLRIFVDGGEELIYSTADSDIRSQDSFRREYAPVSELPEGVRNLVPEEPRQTAEVEFLANQNLVVYRLPFVDEFDTPQGTALFFFGTQGLENRLTREGALVPSDQAVVVRGDAMVLNAPSSEPDDLRRSVDEGWDEISSEEWAYPVVLLGDETRFVVFSSPTDRGLWYLWLAPESEFHMTRGMQVVLLVSVFLSSFLLVFLLLNLRQDPVLVVSERIKRFQINLLRHYFESTEQVSWEAWQRELDNRREELTADIKRGIGRIPKEREEEVDELIDRSWDEIIGVIGSRARIESPPTDIARLESIVQQVVNNLQSLPQTGRVVEQQGSTPVAKTPSPGSDAQPLEETETPDDAGLEEMELVEEAETLEDGELEEIAEEPETPDEAELEEAELVEEADPVEEAEALEEMELVDEAEPVEEAEEAELEEIAEEPETTDEAELEEAELVEEAEPVEEAEFVDEAEPVEEAEALEEMELVEEAEPVEEPEAHEEAETPEELEVSELETPEVAEADEEEPVESLDALDEIDALDRDFAGIQEEWEAGGPEDVESSFANAGDPRGVLERTESSEEPEASESEEAVQEISALENLDELSDEIGDLETLEVFEEELTPEEEDVEEFEELVEDADSGDEGELLPTDRGESFLFGTGLFGASPPRSEHPEDLVAESIEELSEAELEVPGELEPAEVAETETQGVSSASSNTKATPPPSGTIVLEELDLSASPHVDVASLKELIASHRTATEVIRDEEGYYHIDAAAYRQSESGTSDEMKRLVDAVTGGPEEEEEDTRSGIDEILSSRVGLDLFPLSDREDVGSESPAQVPEEDRYKSRVLLTDQGLDYDRFLAGYKRNDSGVFKSMVTFTRIVKARAASIFVKKEEAFVPAYTLGIDDACAQSLSIPTDSYLYRELLHNAQAILFRHPLHYFADFSGACADSHFAYIGRVVICPIRFRGEEAFLFLSAREGIETVEAFFDVVGLQARQTSPA